ncbi:MAG: ATP-binding protein [Candidatus Omnitrophota bacterium]
MFLSSTFNFLDLLPLIIILILGIVLFFKLEELRKTKESLMKLQKTLEETDEQAKLILKTDLELNKTQEQLDKKINSLYTLQKISQEIATTLDENEIFSRIKDIHILELGFERAILFLDDLNKKPSLKLNIGYRPKEIENILDQITIDFYQTIKTKNIISSLDKNDSLIGPILNLFNINSFLIVGITSKEKGVCGFIMVANTSSNMTVNEGDQELITILASQISQALENAHLFEQTWRNQQELEKKVEERTQELSLALEQIKEVSKRKTSFISAVSHELRTPLTSIKGYASILLTEKLGTIPEAIKERLERINRHSDELTALVNDLLDLSRIESGRVQMNLETINLKDIADSSCELLSHQAKERGIDLRNLIGKNLSAVYVDRSQISRVFINLIGNALKFTPKQGKITLEAKEISNNIEVNIADTGIGISEHDAKLIFDEFYRVDNSINETVKGTGLGLALVKSIIEAHKGKIWVKSKVGSGSTFSFSLPFLKK